MNATCCVTENGIRCDQPADCEFVVSCVHEHINHDASCGPHAQRAVELTATDGVSWECIDCGKGPSPHECAAFLDGPHPLRLAGGAG